MQNRSLTILLGLVIAAAALSGWIFGWQWKRAAGNLQDQVDGLALTREEQILVELQDQLEAVLKENERLSGELEKKSNPEE